MKHNTVIKKVLTAALAATLTFTTLAIPTSAAWKTTDVGKQWVETDGTVAKSKWITTKSGDRYYVNSKGIMATGLLNLSEKVNGKKVKNTYYFNKSGVMQTGWQYVNKNYYYFDTKTGRAYKGTVKLSGYTLTFSNKGVWDQKLYKNGKDVTTDALKEKLTGIKQVAKNPDTITIKGQEYSTKLTKLTLNQADLTDEDLEPLKYMTKLKSLSIVPGSYKSGDAVSSGINYWDYTNIKYVGSKPDKYDNTTLYMYEGIRKVRDIAINITNVDFCKYMPKLEALNIAYAPKLTDLTGLQELHKINQLFLFNCTGLKDLHDLDTVDFVYDSFISCIEVTFTDNVKYAFTDLYFGQRLTKTASRSFYIEAATTACKSTVRFQYNASTDNPQTLLMSAPGVAEGIPTWIKRRVVYKADDLFKDDIAL